jgi:hypothetical protein
MKQEVNPIVVIAIIAALVIGVGIFFWRGTAGRSPAQGRMKTDLDTSMMEKNPAEFQKELNALIERDKASRGSK